MRVGLGLVGLLTIRLIPGTIGSGSWMNLVDRSREPWSQLLSTWQRWDALWYQQIATHGYRAGDGTVVFYPLYPLLSRFVSLLLAGHIVLAELVVSSVAFPIAMWLLYRVARLDVRPVAAALTVLLLAFFPTGFFLLAPYTESLYLALTLAAFWFARQNKPWIAGLAGLGAALTRITGAFLVLPLIFLYLRRREQEGKPPGVGLIAATFPALGLLGFSLYARSVVGAHGGIMAVESQWFGYQVASPWQTLSASWMHIAQTGDPIETLNLLCLLAFTALAVWVTLRLPLDYALYVWPNLLLLFTHWQLIISPLMSVSRYTLVLFPCYIPLAAWLVRRPWLAGAGLMVGGMLQTLLFAYWVLWGFVA